MAWELVLKVLAMVEEEVLKVLAIFEDEVSERLATGMEIGSDEHCQTSSNGPTK